LDINNGIGLSESTTQALIILGKLAHTTVLGLSRVGLAPALLRRQRSTLTGSTLFGYFRGQSNIYVGIQKMEALKLFTLRNKRIAVSGLNVD